MALSLVCLKINSRKSLRGANKHACDALHTCSARALMHLKCALLLQESVFFSPSPMDN